MEELINGGEAANNEPARLLGPHASPATIAAAGVTPRAASSNSSPPPSATEHPHGVLPGRDEFFAWVERHKIGQLVDIEPLHVAAYVEALGPRMAKPTVKQHLAAVRMCFDWLVTGGVLTVNPAHAVRGPKHVVKRGKTPVSHRHLDPRRPARPRPDRRHDLCLRPCRRGRRDAVEDYFANETLVGAPA